MMIFILAVINNDNFYFDGIFFLAVWPFSPFVTHQPSVSRPVLSPLPGLGLPWGYMDDHMEWCDQGRHDDVNILITQ